MTTVSTTTPPFGLRDLALDCLARTRRQQREQHDRETQQRRSTLEATLRMRLLRLFNIDGVPLEAHEDAFLAPHWFAIELLDPGVHMHETLFAHVNGSAPVVIIEGVMLAPNTNHLVVGTWHSDGSPTDLMPISSLYDLGYWCEQRITEDEEQAVHV